MDTPTTPNQDKTYFDYLPMIDGYVGRWSHNDKILKCQGPDYIVEDCRSFAYLYWVKCRDRFTDDPTAAAKLYISTVKHKLRDYICKFYQHEQSDESKAVITPFDPTDCHSLFHQYVDAQMAQDDEYNFINLDIAEDAKLNIILQELKLYLPKRYRPYISEFVRQARTYAAKKGNGHKIYSADTARRKLHIGSYGSIQGHLTVAVDKFIADYPEFKDWLRSYSQEDLDLTVQGIQVKQEERRLKYAPCKQINR